MFSIFLAVDCSCDHHEATPNSSVPWTPKVPAISRPIPNLVRVSTPRNTFSGLDQNLLESQISINTNMIDQINALKEERERNAKLYEKTMKEKALLERKFNGANEQLNYLKKKFGKYADKENKKPNEENKKPDEENKEANTPNKESEDGSKSNDGHSSANGGEKNE